jgi:hypothetical protein
MTQGNSAGLGKLGPWLTIAVQFVTVLTMVSGGAWFLVKDPLQQAITEGVSKRITEVETETNTKIDALQTAFNERNAALELRISRMEAKTDLEPELRSLITLRCMGQNRLEFTINRLKREYLNRTGRDYEEPNCSRLTP